MDENVAKPRKETLLHRLKERIPIKAMVAEEVAPGVIMTDFGWGNPGDGGLMLVL